MLKIINNLNPFFEDCYRRISIREYGKIIRVSPPTASKLLNQYNKENLLKKEEDRNYIFFYANKKDKQLLELSRIYWDEKLNELISFFEKRLVNPTIILFGSLSKAETKKDSDVDLAVFVGKKKLDFKEFEKKLKRGVQIFWFKSLKDVKNKELLNNIMNGYILTGKLRF